MDTMINPSEWRISKEFRHSDVIYGIGEPVPEMSAEDAEELRDRGFIARLGESPRRRTDMAPRAEAEYLRGTDIQVLRRVRQHAPRGRSLRRIYEAARHQRRSPVLLEALLLALGDKVRPAEATTDSTSPPYAYDRDAVIAAAERARAAAGLDDVKAVVEPVEPEQPVVPVEPEQPVVPVEPGAEQPVTPVEPVQEPVVVPVEPVTEPVVEPVVEPVAPEPDAVVVEPEPVEPSAPVVDDAPQVEPKTESEPQ